MRIAMIEHGSQGGDMTTGAPDSSRGDVSKAASDIEMMWHREVHVGKRSHVARHVPSSSRFIFTSAQFLFRHEPGGPMIWGFPHMSGDLEVSRPHRKTGSDIPHSQC
ncbi:hypothetical protein Taro_046240 [Colocasia esculenta]|uniref:Uncharacterized protein n=1 Tax=Colocasia esculenta TaxID=4460 RepID=A0A843X3V6_COLES|nr:hypothetical protein [Colocasia esculenta]